VIAQVFDAARLTTPEVTAASGNAGRDGGHTEAMGVLLAEMQSVARAHQERPGDHDHDHDHDHDTSAYDVAAAVKDPELPMLTISDLGILRAVRQNGDHVTVDITPTYSGCPAMGAIRADVTQR